MRRQFTDGQIALAHRQVEKGATIGEICLKKAKIADFHFHDCHHHFASWMVMKGAPIMVVKELLGHKTLAMNLRYGTLAPRHAIRATSLLDENPEKTPQSLHIAADLRCGEVREERPSPL